MKNVLVIKNRDGRKIYLSEERWKHIKFKHPELSNIEEIRETIEKPSIIKQDKFDENLNYYYYYNKKKKRFLMTSVKYLNEGGFILTSFYTKYIRK